VVRGVFDCIDTAKQMTKSVILIRLIAIVALLGLNGCVSWHRTDLTSSGTDQTLTYTQHGFGLFPRICGFFWASGDALEKSTIQLNGVKDHYTESEFTIVDWDGKPIEHLRGKTGTVTFDRKSHVVVIKIYLGGKPLEINGRYSYREKRS